MNLDPLSRPHGMFFADGKAYFTAEVNRLIGRYDPAANKVDWILGTGQNRTHMIYVTSDEKQVYTTNVESGTVSILEYVLIAPTGPPGRTPPPGAHPHMDWVQTIIPVSKGSEGFDVSPDGRELWTAAADDGTLSIIDIAAKKLIVTIDAKVAGQTV